MILTNSDTGIEGKIQAAHLQLLSKTVVMGKGKG